MPLEPGVLLNRRYRIDSLHKLGTNGAVYRAFDTTLNVPVAVKENLVADPAFQRQFIREAAFLARFRHANIPHGTDCFTNDDGQFLVMDFIEGENLSDWIAHDSLPSHELFHMLDGAFAALIYIHSRNPPVIHRDVNPSNMILSSLGSLILVDFGLASAVGRFDARTDVYSLAATIYALLTFHNPADALERAKGREDLKPARTLNPAIPSRVEAALERALAIRPDDRYPHIAAFRQALGESP
jgi:serine/threonine protein kinase